MVEHLSDDEIRNLPRGGHDYRKLYAAYKAATEQRGAPTVILAKTIKGWTLGPDVEGRNATHQIKKMTVDQLQGAARPALPPGRDPRGRPGRRQGAALLPARRGLARARSTCSTGARRSTGRCPSRVVRIRRPLAMPEDKPFDELLAGLGQAGGVDHDGLHPPAAEPAPRPQRRAAGGADHPRRGPHVRHGRAVQGVQDLRLAGPALRAGRRPAAAVLQRGQGRAGPRGGHHRGRARWPRSSPPPPSYAHRGVPMVPFFTFYSMFGFQRVGDLIWSAADSRARGFLLGATAGRTTLLGEGLQHQDGHSLVLASTVPTVEAYDPAFAYEMATIVQHGIQRDAASTSDDVFYYLTLYNENYLMPPLPEGADEGILRGPVPLGRRPRGARAPGHDPVLGHGPGRGPRRAGRAGRALGRGRRAVVGDHLQAPARGGAVGRALEPPAPDRGATHAAGHRAAGRRRGPGRRSSPSPTS